MSLRHTVQSGEYLGLIAARYGFASARVLYDHPENAELKARRPDPNLLFPGDVIVIPGKVPPKFQCTTGKNHVFALRTITGELEVCLQTSDGQPVRERRWVLSFGAEEAHGTLGQDGTVRAPLPPNVSSATLTLFMDDEGAVRYELQLLIGALDPVDTVSGQQGRLVNLGFPAGPLDGVAGPRTRAALRAFQKVKGMDVTGDPNASTRSALEAAHGC